MSVVVFALCGIQTQRRLTLCWPRRQSRPELPQLSELTLLLLGAVASFVGTSCVTGQWQLLLAPVSAMELEHYPAHRTRSKSI